MLINSADALIDARMLVLSRLPNNLDESAMRTTDLLLSKWR